MECRLAAESGRHPPADPRHGAARGEERRGGVGRHVVPVRSNHNNQDQTTATATEVGQ